MSKKYPIRLAFVEKKFLISCDNKPTINIANIQPNMNE
jgi:hypothetical protein